MASTFFTTTYADAEKLDALFVQKPFASLRVGEMRVTAVDDQVTLIQMRQKIVDHRIDRFSRRHEKHYLPWQFQTGHKIRDIIDPGKGKPLALLDQQIKFVVMFVVADAGESVFGNIE